MQIKRHSNMNDSLKDLVRHANNQGLKINISSYKISLQAYIQKLTMCTARDKPKLNKNTNSCQTLTRRLK